LKGKVAVITGSSRGIGKATALLFAKEGAKVVVNYLNNKDKAQEVVDSIKRMKGEAIMVKADVSKKTEVEHLFKEAVKAFGTVDILVNNAGIAKPKPFLELTVEDIHEVFDANVLSAILCSQEAAKIMLGKKYGKIINICSISGTQYTGNESNIHYASSKAALANFTSVLAKVLSPDINVNAIAPGGVETDMAKSWSPEYREVVMKRSYLRRLTKPEEIANTCLFLASDESRAIMGEIIIVAGGGQLK
jgi:3-oxoacyl-[acyl-carrier protein] reductase